MSCQQFYTFKYFAKGKFRVSFPDRVSITPTWVEIELKWPRCWVSVLEDATVGGAPHRRCTALHGSVCPMLAVYDLCSLIRYSAYVHVPNHCAQAPGPCVVHSARPLPHHTAGQTHILVPRRHRY